MAQNYAELHKKTAITLKLVIAVNILNLNRFLKLS